MTRQSLKASASYESEGPHVAATVAKIKSAPRLTVSALRSSLFLPAEILSRMRRKRL